MKRDSLNENFWNNRYLENDTGWDLGAISPAIKKWFDTKKNKDLQILIPGAGKGHEVKYGFDHGFNNIHYLDISTEAVTFFKDNCPNLPKEQILISDFFDLKKDLFFDVVIEQTFFCAISPVLRKSYVKKTHEIQWSFNNFIKKRGARLDPCGFLFGLAPFFNFFSKGMA